jgi:hypothetical protein
MRNILIMVAEQAPPVVINYYCSSLPNNTKCTLLHSQLTGLHLQINVQIYLISKAPNHLFHHVENFNDLHSNHSVVLTTNSSPPISSNNPYLVNKTTDWVKFNDLLLKTTKFDIQLKSPDDI